MTSDDLPLVESELTRFDMGSETFGVGLGGTTAFQGVTILNGSVLVADFLSNAIHMFAPDGTSLGVFAPFDDATYLETDSGGSVYSTPLNLVGSVSSRFDSLGIPTETFTHANLTNPSGIDADAAGNVYVANNGTTTRLFKFASDGTFLNGILLGSIRPGDLSIDEASDLLYMADSNDASAGIKIFDISGVSPILIDSISTPADSAIEGIHFAAESGNILATDLGALSFDPRGLEYSPSGTLLEEYRPTGAILAFDITTYAVPEPSSLSLVVLGILTLAWRRR